MDCAGTSKDATPGPGWLPARVRQQGGEAMIDWVFFGARPLSEPFYEDSVAKVRHAGPGALISTPLAELARQIDRMTSLEPTGLIFHLSRCGSTLASQMLAVSPANLVVSEASPIDAVVRLRAGEGQRIGLLRAMVGALGQARAGERRYFLKLDSWHACALPLFRQAFPQTPWAFIYRDPAAVMVSHARRTGMQMVSQLVPPGFYGLDPDTRSWGERYWAEVLGAICEAVLREHSAGGGLLVNYDDLPAALCDSVLPHFGVAASAAEVEAMADAARFDAKAPDRRFTPDARAKRAATTAAIATAIRGRLTDAYDALERLRLAH